jgi:flagellar protein FlbD
VILVTRLRGTVFALNPDLIERAEGTPDTVVTLVDGTKFVVLEPLDVLSSRVVQYRASVVATARELPGSDIADRPARASGHHGDLFAVEVPALADADVLSATDQGPGARQPAEPAPVLAEPVPLHRRRRH